LEEVPITSCTDAGVKAVFGAACPGCKPLTPFDHGTDYYFSHAAKYRAARCDLLQSWFKEL